MVPSSRLEPVTLEASKRHKRRQNEERLRYAGLWKDNGLNFLDAHLFGPHLPEKGRGDLYRADAAHVRLVASVVVEELQDPLRPSLRNVSP